MGIHGGRAGKRGWDCPHSSSGLLMKRELGVRSSLRDTDGSVGHGYIYSWPHDMDSDGHQCQRSLVKNKQDIPVQWLPSDSTSSFGVQLQGLNQQVCSRQASPMSRANKCYCTDSQIYRLRAVPISSVLHIGKSKRYSKVQTTRVRKCDAHNP